MFIKFLISLVIWIFYAIVYKRISTKFWLSKCLLPLLLLWILITVDLAVNFLGASIPELNDGIGLHGVLSYLIVGEKGWSIQLFEKLYHEAVYISLALLVVYSVLLVGEGRKINRIVLIY